MRRSWAYQILQRQEGWIGEGSTGREAEYGAWGNSRAMCIADIPQRLTYKIHVLVRASPISRILDWSYIKGGLIAQFRHANATYPYFV